MFFRKKVAKEFKVLKDYDFFYELFEKGRMVNAKKSVKITTANLNEMMVPVPGFKEYVSVGNLFKLLVKRKVEISIIYRKFTEPFRRDIKDKKLHKNKRFHLFQNERNHSKMVIIDDRLVVLGSANFSGRGIGARSREKRNFELGVLTDNPNIVKYCIDYFDEIKRDSIKT